MQKTELEWFECPTFNGKVLVQVHVFSIKNLLMLSYHPNFNFFSRLYFPPLRREGLGKGITPGSFALAP